MCNTTLFAFSKGNRLIKIRMNIIKGICSEEIIEFSPDCVSRIETGDIGKVVESEVGCGLRLYTPGEVYPLQMAFVPICYSLKMTHHH